MALARNYLGRSTSGTDHGAGGYTTGSLTPDAKSLLVVLVFTTGSAGTENFSANLTIADSLNHVWTQRAFGENTSWTGAVKIFTAPNTATTAFTVTADCGSDSVYRYYIDVFSYTGQHLNPIGATAASSNQAGDGAVSTTLSRAPLSTSEVVAGLVNVIGTTNGLSTVTHGTGWTEIADSHTDGWLIAQSQVRTGSTSATVGWDDAQVGPNDSNGTGLVALEIVETSRFAFNNFQFVRADSGISVSERIR